EMGIEGEVVDRLWILDLAVRRRQNLLRARDRDPDLVEHLSRRLRAEEIHHFLVHHRLLDRVSISGLWFIRSSCRHPRLQALRGEDVDGRGSPGHDGIYSAASAVSPPRPCFELCRSTLRPSERISLTSTLKDSGMPASNVSSPRTIASYTLVRPATSSDFTVSISCSVYAAP